MSYFERGESITIKDRGQWEVLDYSAPLGGGPIRVYLNLIALKPAEDKPTSWDRGLARIEQGEENWRKSRKERK
jgi:hypothetical protein